MKHEGGYLVGRIKLLTGRMLNRLLAQNELFDFNSEQGKILYSLWKKDIQSVSQIAEDTGLAVNSISIMLGHLEEAGLLQRKHCNKDKRKKLICLTEKGRSLEAKTRELNQKMDTIFYKGFTEEEIQTFEGNLQRITNNLLEEL